MNLARLFLAFLFLFSPLSAAELFLKEKLAEARSGDYFVLLQNKTYTILHVRQKSGSTLSLDEIALPVGLQKEKRPQWSQWLQSQAPGHSHWLIYDIDLQSASISKAYSKTKGHAVQIEAYESFLATLIRLSFKPVPLEERRKIGQKSDAPDRRTLWHPPLIAHGQKVEKALFSAWKASWPEDNTPLSGKKVEIYLAETKGAYPAYFPFWISISKSLGQGIIRLVDCGNVAKQASF
jgi:hypothetical protein